MIRLLHFADAHIDMAAGQGRHDPLTGLPVRVLDFLHALDSIIDTAISEKVDLVIFAGDAYKDRNPSPTYQREWGRRLMRLAQAQIPALLVVGNHDLSPAAGRANTLHEFDTLQVPFIHVISKPEFLGPDDLWGLPIQVIGLPWVTRSGFLAARGSRRDGFRKSEYRTGNPDRAAGWRLDCRGRSRIAAPSDRARFGAERSLWQ